MLNRRLERTLYWAPRLMMIAFAGFLSIFALDVFGESAGFVDTAIALLLHLVPSFLVLMVLWLAWRREAVGGGLLLLLCVGYCASTWGRFPVATYLTIAGPLSLAGVLFAAHRWLCRSRGTASSTRRSIWARS